MSEAAINQWNDAACKFMQVQESSNFASINKGIVKTRFSKMDGKRVLDLGCGYGYYTHYFYSVGADTIGCDGSRSMLELAKNKYPSCVFEWVDIDNELNYRKDLFDLVFCNQVFMSIERLEHVIREIYKIIQPGGIFYFSVVHPAFYDSRWLADEDGWFNKLELQRYL